MNEPDSPEHNPPSSPDVATTGEVSKYLDWDRGTPVPEEATIDEASRTEDEPEQTSQDEDDPQGSARIQDEDLSNALEKITPIQRSDLRYMFFVLVALLMLGLLFVLDYAQPVLLPVFLAWTFNLLLSPVVRTLRRYGVPSSLGAVVAMFLIVAFVGGISYQAVGPAVEQSERLDELKTKLRSEFAPLLRKIDEMKKAGDDVMAATGTAEPEDPFEAPLKVQEVGDNNILSNLLTQASVTGATLFSTAVLLYFLLAGGDRFQKKIVDLTPDYEQKWRVVEITRSVEEGISTYLLAITVINIGLGICVAAAMWLLGMPNPLLWGTMCTVFNYVPYVGALVGTVIVGLFAFVESTTLGYAILVPTVYLGLTAIEGNFVTPLVLGYRLNLNPVFIVVSLLFWGWLWGIGGAILAVPILAAVKILSDHVEVLRPLGTFLVR